MLPDGFDPGLLAVCALGLASTLLGFLGLVSPLRAWGLPAVAGAGGVLGGLGAAFVACGGQYGPAWPVLMSPAALCFALVGLRAGLHARACGWIVRLLQHRCLPWVALLVTGLCLAWAASPLLHTHLPVWERPPGYLSSHEPVPLRMVRSGPALTDAGRPIPVYLPAGEISAQDLRETDEFLVSAWELNVQAIRTAPPGAGYNCHGWVFAGGKCWIQGKDVPAILEDNGYLKVSDPRAGDLVIYSDREGAITHSGIVRAAAPDGLLLVESKFGKAGRFVHGPDVVRYEGDPVYYRSGRHGHVVRLPEEFEASGGSPLREPPRTHTR